MLADVNFPSELTPDKLDHYLEKGWFRAEQSVFTTNFLHFGGILYSALWLRFRLENFDLSASQQKKFLRAKRFTFSVQPFEYTSEKEELFAIYREDLTFTTASSLKRLLYGNSRKVTSVFSTYEVTIRDGGRLIGVGIFDKGNAAAAGIVSFFHPDYRKYSLGTLLILQKICYAKSCGFTYFYPGYFAPGYSMFDYKLNFSGQTTEFYEIEHGSWLPITAYNPENHDIIQRMYRKLETLKMHFRENNSKADSSLLIYDFFDLNLTHDFNGKGILDIPLFWLLNDRHDLTKEVVIFNPLNGKYQHAVCDVLYEIPGYIARKGHFNQQILGLGEVIGESDTGEELIKTPRLIY